MSRYGRRFSMVLMLLAPTFAWSAPQDATEINGQLQKSDPKDPVRQQPAKIHEIKLSAGRSYQIDLMSSDFDSYLRLVDSTGKEVASDDDGGDKFNSRLKYTAPKDDTYKVYVTTFAGGEGNYVLKVQGGAAVAKAGAAEVVLSVNGAIQAGDGADPVTNRPCKIHEVKLKKGTPYVIDMMSRDFDTFLRLVDDTGRELAQDDDGGEGLNSRIRFTADKDATYKIYAQPLGNQAGAYSLAVATVGAQGGVAGGVTDLAAPTADKATQHQGQILATDTPDKVRRNPAKVHLVDLKGGKTYQIDLTGQFDTYLRLEGPNGQPLAQDDDSGGNLNARLVFMCPADGRYRVIATSFGRGTGAYNLLIAEQP